MSARGTIELRQLAFDFGARDFALRVPEWTVAGGERVALAGPSGCGKTTLLNLIAGILTPGAGSVRVGAREVSAASEAARRAFRSRSVGMVFQDFALIEYLDVAENILLPFRIGAALALTDEVRARARRLAAAVGLEGKLARRIDRLSHGERQRVAICRALLPGPEVLLADEPTGNLDAKTASTIMDLLFEQTQAAGATLVVVSHDPKVLERFERAMDVAKWHAEAAA